IEIDEHKRLDGIGAEPNHGTLGSPADGPCQMKSRTLGRSAREDEMAECRDLGVEAVDPALEPRDAVFGDDGLLHAPGDLVRGIGEARSQREQVALDLYAHVREMRIESR